MLIVGRVRGPPAAFGDALAVAADGKLGAFCWPGAFCRPGGEVGCAMTASFRTMLSEFRHELHGTIGVCRAGGSPSQQASLSRPTVSGRASAPRRPGECS